MFHEQNSCHSVLPASEQDPYRTPRSPSLVALFYCFFLNLLTPMSKT